MNQPITMKLWAVVTPAGLPVSWSTRNTDELTIEQFTSQLSHQWEWYEAKGYTCKQFDVTFKVVEANAR